MALGLSTEGDGTDCVSWGGLGPSVSFKMFCVLYRSVMDSAICIGTICWGSCIGASDSKKLNKLIKKAGSVLGTDLEPLEGVQRRMLHKVTDILDITACTLHYIVLKQQHVFSQRFLQL